MYEREILELFNAMVVDKVLPDYHNDDWIGNGVITYGFNPTHQQQSVLLDYFKPLDIVTLFTPEERKKGDTYQLLRKQWLHYLEVYGLNRPGLFNLEVSNGKIVTIKAVQGITVEELEKKVQALLCANAPVKDSVALKNIIDHYLIRYDVNEIKNNELRVLLYDVIRDIFKNGDDVVRYICYKATGFALLIKSKEVIIAVIFGRVQIPNHFLDKHEFVLSQIFNKHKKIIMTLKHKNNANIINRISRKKYRNHVPIGMPKNKTSIS